MAALNKPLILARQAGPQLILGLLLAVFLVTGWLGLDFGYHWDEQLVLEEVSRPLESGVFLPRSYNYPSMLFDIGTVVLLPKTIPFLVRIAKESTPYYSQAYQEIVPKEKVAPLVAFAKSKPFHLRLRAIFLVITSLTGVWVFLAVRACKRSGWEAAFAAAVILTSWELAYHGRWLAPDTVQMQFAALWLMLFAFALHSSSRPRLWLRLSAAAAGLACGTKYQGGTLLVPVLIYAAILTRTSLSPRSVGAAAKEIMYNVVIFTGVFLISTPGMLLEPLAFCQSVRHISHQYATGHLGYTVGAVGEHGYRLLSYLTCVLTSHWPAAALVLSAVACLGIVTMWKERPLVVMLLLCAPLAFVLFMVCYRVMMARNYLLLAPFIAFFSARGAFHLWKALAAAIWIRRMLVTGFVALFIVNASFLCFAAQTIAPGAGARFGADIVTYLKKHPKEQYFLSAKVAEAVARENVTLSNTTRDPSAAQRYLLYSGDAPRERLSCNRVEQYQRVSGPLEVNFNYYADWQGAGRVVVLSMQRAYEMQLLPKL
jgi:hypothetical protein